MEAAHHVEPFFFLFTMTKNPLSFSLSNMFEEHHMLRKAAAAACSSHFPALLLDPLKGHCARFAAVAQGFFKAACFLFTQGDSSSTPVATERGRKGGLRTQGRDPLEAHTHTQHTPTYTYRHAEVALGGESCRGRR